MRYLIAYATTLVLGTSAPTDNLSRPALPRQPSGEQRAVHPVRAVGVGVPPHHKLWKCVHRNEHSAWDDDGAPYYGGLQMGWWFMRTYAGALLRAKGTANHWTPLEQMWVAERAFKSEGYSVRWFNSQWPPSAGRCGL